MMNHAQNFIEQMRNDQEKNNPDLYENIVIRVDQKYAAMITVLGSILKFPASTAFTDILTKHLFDMAVTMSDEKYEKIIKDIIQYDRESDDNFGKISSPVAKNTIDALIMESRVIAFNKCFKL